MHRPTVLISLENSLKSFASNFVPMSSCSFAMSSSRRAPSSPASPPSSPICVVMLTSSCT